MSTLLPSQVVRTNFIKDDEVKNTVLVAILRMCVQNGDTFSFEVSMKRTLWDPFVEDPQFALLKDSELVKKALKELIAEKYFEHFTREEMGLFFGYSASYLRLTPKLIGLYTAAN